MTEKIVNEYRTRLNDVFKLNFTLQQISPHIQCKKYINFMTKNELKYSEFTNFY